MKWNDKVLIFKEDWAEAMASLTNQNDADRFKLLAKMEFPAYCEEVLGYLTGDIHPKKRKQIQELLSVTHPIVKRDDLTPLELFLLGRNGPRPEWWDIVQEIPRLDSTNLYFKDN
jgi:hypothetical protein